MKFWILLVFIVGFLWSCASPAFFQPFSLTPYPPTQEIHILVSPPGRPYVEIGLIEVEKWGEDVSQSAMKKGQQIGADALILLAEEDDGAVHVGVPGAGGAVTVVSQNIKRIKYLAIKYQQIN